MILLMMLVRGNTFLLFSIHGNGFFVYYEFNVVVVLKCL